MSEEIPALVMVTRWVTGSHWDIYIPCATGLTCTIRYYPDKDSPIEKAFAC